MSLDWQYYKAGLRWQVIVGDHLLWVRETEIGWEWKIATFEIRGGYVYRVDFLFEGEPVAKRQVAIDLLEAKYKAMFGMTVPDACDEG